MCLWGETQAAAFGGSPRAWTAMLLVPTVATMVVSLACGLAVGALWDAHGVPAWALPTAVAVAVAIIVAATAWTVGLTAARRASLRAKYGIPGTACDDCTVWLCFGACAAAQEARTVRALQETGGAEV